MNKPLVTEIRTSIDATRKLVWQALTSPAAIRQYMFGAQVESGWTPGSDITWKGEYKGRKFEDHGEIIDIEPEHLLRYTHFSGSSGQPDRPENYPTVTIDLAEAGTATEVLLSQDNNPNEAARAESEKNWSLMLDGLKKYVERQAHVA